MLGLKNGKIVAVASRFWAPKKTGKRFGIPTRSARLQTIFATELELGIFLKISRSKAHPTTGPITTTETRKARKPGQPWICVRYVKMNAEANACAPNAKLKTPVA